MYDFVRLDGILMTWSRASFVGLGWNVVGAVTISVWTGRNHPQMMYTKFIRFWTPLLLA